VADRAQHCVLFKFPRELSAEEENEMLEQIRAWPKAIPGFTGLRFGKDVGGRSAGYDYLLVTEFEDEEAHQAYYSQPAHVAFAEWVAERNVEVIRVDYALTEDALLL
jgi:heme-degrading monooxygenase HmoA